MYTAVILCEPTANDDVVNVAVLPDNVAVPIFTVPSKNVTVPVGVPVPVDTVTVKVTLWPTVDGFNDEVILVVVDTGVTGGVTGGVTVAAFTTWINTGDVLLL